MVETRTAIVTGGAGGIGKATVRRLLDGGLSVFIVDADQESLDAILAEFGTVSGRLDGWRADVVDEQQVMRSGQSRRRAVRQHLRAGPCRGRRRAQARPRHRGFPAAGMGARHRSQPDERLSRRARRGAADAQAARGTDRAFFLDHRRRRERAADDGDRAAALRDGEGGAARLHRAACQGPGGVGHHGECADAGIDSGRAGHADSRQVRQSAARAAGGAVERLSRRTPGTGDEVAAAVEFLLSESAGFISGVALPVDGAYR